MLEIESLLEPVSQDNPTGRDLSFSAELDAIAEARRADDPTLEQGAWQTDLKVADWPQVIQIGSRLLETTSKDLRIAVWLAEARTQIDGFAGLAWGYRLTAALCQGFWDDLFPQDEDDDDGSLRVGHIRWLLTHSERWARALPITHSSDGHFSANDFQAAYQRSDQAGEMGHPTREDVDTARQSTPFEHFNGLAATVRDCQAALAELESVIDKKAGDDSPGFLSCREALEHIRDTLMRCAHGNAHTPATDSSDDTKPRPTQTAPVAGATTEPPVSGQAVTSDIARTIPSTISSRREALESLREVAAYFRHTEPHSPVAYLADKAATWGEMPLHVWLRRVIKDDAALSHVEELLDVNSPGGGG